MRWSRSIYTASLDQQQAEELKKRLEDGDFSCHAFLITLSSCRDDLLDIRETSQLKYVCVRQLCPLIVGLGADRQDALEVVCRITEECLKQTGDVRLKEYLREKENAAHAGNVLSLE